MEEQIDKIIIAETDGKYKLFANLDRCICPKCGRLHFSKKVKGFDDTCPVCLGLFDDAKGKGGRLERMC